MKVHGSRAITKQHRRFLQEITPFSSVLSMTTPVGDSVSPPVSSRSVVASPVAGPSSDTQGAPADLHPDHRPADLPYLPSSCHDDQSASHHRSRPVGYTWKGSPLGSDSQDWVYYPSVLTASTLSTTSSGVVASTPWGASTDPRIHTFVVF